MTTSFTVNGRTTFTGRGDVGLGFIGTAGLISAASTGTLLLYFAVSPLRRAISTQAVSRGVSQFLRDPLGWYMVSMLLSDFCQGSGFVLNLVWAKYSALWLGPACTAQAGITEFGDVGCALFSLLISLHTFVVLFLRKTPPRWACALVIAFSWLLILFITLVGPAIIAPATGKGDFYGNSGAWCWISINYQVERFFFLYFFIFLSTGTSWFCNSNIYLRSRRRTATKTSPSAIASQHNKEMKTKVGCTEAPSATSTVAETEEVRPAKSVRRPSMLTTLTVGRPVDEETLGRATLSEERTEAAENTITALSNRMLLYPCFYTACILPVSISRLSVMNKTPVPLGFIMFSGILFASSGTVNVILWLATRQAYIARQARRVSYAVTTTVEVSPASDYELAFVPQAMSDHDAELAAKHDLDRVALHEKPFEDGEPMVLHVVPRLVPAKQGARSGGLTFVAGS